MTKKELEKLKPGDKVKIVRERVVGMNCMGEMDKWLGKVMTVKERIDIDSIHMFEDQHEHRGRGWYWDKDMIECKVTKAENTIRILRRGNKTIAKCGKKVGIARCSAADEYDEAKGAIIAVARLYGYDVVSDKIGKVTLASEERRRMKKDDTGKPKWRFGTDMIDCKVERNTVDNTEDAETQVERKPAYELLPWDEAKKAVAGTEFSFGDTICGISEFTWESMRRENKVITDDCDEEEKEFLRKKGLIGIYSIGFSWEIPECCIVHKGNDASSDVVRVKLAEGVFDKLLKETAKERVQKELAELEERIEKLSHAFAPLADKLGTESEAYNLLSRQLDVMRIYAEILKRRLAIWKD